MFLKIAAQAFETADFLNIFLRFLGLSKAHFLIKKIILKRRALLPEVCDLYVL